MTLLSAARSAYEAFREERRRGGGQDSASKLKTPPRAAVGPAGPRTRETLGAQRVAYGVEGRPVRKGRRRSPIAVDVVRWLRSDIEYAQHQANSGTLQRAAQIAEWNKQDLVVGGLLCTRCSVPRLPRVYRGDQKLRDWLEGSEDKPGVFDRILPPSELEELAIDQLNLGVGVAMFIQPDYAPYPKLIRLDPQFLVYLAGEDRYIYRSYGKTYDVTPGDGVWVLHKAQEQDPWRKGIWAELGEGRVSSVTAGLHRDGFISKYGNPAVVITNPNGANDAERLKNAAAYALNWAMSVFSTSPGYDVKLVQATAEGREVFSDAQARAREDAMIRIAGQVVTSLGGSGFVNAEIFQMIASHLVARTGDDLATCLNEQALPVILGWQFGAQNDNALQLRYDTTPPQARKAEAEAISAAMDAHAKLKTEGYEPDDEEFKARYRLPVKALPEGKIADKPTIFGYHIETGAVTWNQAQEALGFKGIGPEGDIPITIYLALQGKKYGIVADASQGAEKPVTETDSAKEESEAA